QSCNTGLKRGLASYRPGFGATAAMTAESMACRVWLGSQNKPEQLAEGTQYLLQRLPSLEQPDFYYWYYGSLSLRFVGGESWERWTLALTQTLPKMQRSDGSWSAVTKWAGYGGTVYSTAMGALCLESFYRYQ
ncbi:MAG: squalene--hopene cyclase, partial [Pirellulaceae bacterium]|nr:squalene--hopene cyclase [Pirellulaceae bacterium]